MPIRFALPSAWRTLTGSDLTDVVCDAATVGEALQWLAGVYPKLRQRLFTDAGELAPWTLVCLNDTDVRTLRGLQTPTDEGGEVQVVPALMGG